MLPLELQLTLRRSQSDPRAQRTYLLPVKGISASLRLDQDQPEVCVYRRDRRGMRTKASELRVMAIALGFAPEYRASEQTFSPECHQSLGIEILGMECPEPHD
jgi:hypothetical protein